MQLFNGRALRSYEAILYGHSSSRYLFLDGIVLHKRGWYKTREVQVQLLEVPVNKEFQK